MPSVSIVGCGYTGIALARRWLAAGAHVRGFAARTESLEAILACGAEARALNLDQVPRPIECGDALVYYAVPPAPTGGGDPRLERFLGGVTGRPARLIYLSTTGVYGDHGGARVDEDTPPGPHLTGRARRRLAAEGEVRAWADAHGISWCILRIAGIYGPGRLPLERLRRAEPAILPQESTPSNRIHVDDLAAACFAAGASERAHRRVYNVSDGSDDSLTAYLQRVARIAGLPAPPLISREAAQRSLSQAAWSFLAESRRIDNRRMIEELGVSLAYADLDAGIRASLTAS